MIARFFRWLKILRIRFVFLVAGTGTNDHDRWRWRHYIETGDTRGEAPR